MIVYHYTQFDNWKKTKESGNLLPRSLQSLHREVSDRRGSIRATFALLKPEPQEWIENPIFPTLWPDFQGTRGDLLLNVQADEKKILVGDAGYIEGYLYRKHHDELHIPPEYAITDPDIAFSRYQASLISLQRYREKGLRYIVPEIQIRFPVELHNVSVSRQQPLLERELGRGKLGDVGNHPLPSINKFRQDLAPWLDDFKQKNPYIEGALQRIGSRRSKENLE